MAARPIPPEAAPMPTHIAIYARSSSRPRDTVGQEPDLRRWAKERTETVRWYRDKSSGAATERPGFARLMADVRDGKVSAIVIWRLDRLGQTAKGLSSLFEQWLRSRVNLISLRDELDLSRPAGRLAVNVLASVAAY